MSGKNRGFIGINTRFSHESFKQMVQFRKKIRRGFLNFLEVFHVKEIMDILEEAVPHKPFTPGRQEGPKHTNGITNQYPFKGWGFIIVGCSNQAGKEILDFLPLDV